MTTRRRPPVLLVPLLVPLLLASACAHDDRPVAAPTGSSSGTVAVDYPAEGVDLAGRPALEGVYVDALQTYVDFERGRRQAAREGRVGRLLSFNATSDVVDTYREALASYGAGARGPAEGYAGDVVVEFLDVRPRGDLLRVEVCVDATGLDVPAGAPAVLGEATRSRQRIDVRNFEGPWRVTSVEPVPGSC